MRLFVTKLALEMNGLGTVALDGDTQWKQRCSFLNAYTYRVISNT
jgi:hypothetical protein